MNTPGIAQPRPFGGPQRRERFFDTTGSDRAPSKAPPSIGQIAGSDGHQADGSTPATFEPVGRPDAAA